MPDIKNTFFYPIYNCFFDWAVFTFHLFPTLNPVCGPACHLAVKILIYFNCFVGFVIHKEYLLSPLCTPRSLREMNLFLFFQPVGAAVLGL